MIQKLFSSLVSKLVSRKENPVAAPISTEVTPAKNLSVPETETVERPIVSELKKALREKYPFSKFQTVFLSKNPYWGEYTVHYGSKDIHLPFSQFCAQFGIDPSSIGTERVNVIHSDENRFSKEVNQFKQNVLSDVGILPKYTLAYKNIITSYALKCSFPRDYAEKTIIPVAKKNANLLRIKDLGVRNDKKSFFGAKENFVYLCPVQKKSFKRCYSIRNGIPRSIFNKII